MAIKLFALIVASSTIPVMELRGTIPFFLARYPELPIWFVTTGAIIGNLLPCFVLLWFMPRITHWLHDHLAPRINRTVVWLHELIVKNSRQQWIYWGVPMVTLAASALLFHLGIRDLLWHIAVFIGVPLWSYIVFLVCKKAHEAALEETSIIHWFYNKVHREHSAKFYRWGLLALILIVAVPLPGTGAWTGSLLAFLMGVPYWKAIGLIFIGLIISGLLVAALSTGIINGIGLL
ncbi:MAG: small multi-drug export protein [bacterium]|nr:small multi-drug export protein [bacterium]